MHVFFHAIGLAIGLGLLTLVVGCSGGGGSSVKSPGAPRDAKVTARPDSFVSRTTSKELKALPITQFGVGLDGVAGMVSEAKTLHVYGTNLADRSFKRISVTRAGGVKIRGLTGIAKADHSGSLQRCGGQIQVTKMVSGPGNKWRLLSLDLLLSSQIPATPLPRFGTTGFVVPKLLCDGGTAWLIWSTAKQTRVQIRTGGKWSTTHDLKAPARGWPAYVVPRIHAVAWGGKLYMLRSSSSGVEAILVGAKGEVRRSVLVAKESHEVTLARVGKRFLAVWVETTRRRKIFRATPGRIMGRWLDTTFTPSGSDQMYLKHAPSSNMSLHLWTSPAGGLVMGRTVRVPRKLMGGGFRYEITSYVTGYDVTHVPRGPWLPVGDSTIYAGTWIADTLLVVMKGRQAAGNHVHVRRFRFGP